VSGEVPETPTVALLLPIGGFCLPDLLWTIFSNPGSVSDRLHPALPLKDYIMCRHCVLWSWFLHKFCRNLHILLSRAGGEWIGGWKHEACCCWQCCGTLPRSWLSETSQTGLGLLHGGVYSRTHTGVTTAAEAGTPQKHLRTIGTEGLHLSPVTFHVFFSIYALKTMGTKCYRNIRARICLCLVSVYGYYFFTMLFCNSRQESIVKEA